MYLAVLGPLEVLDEGVEVVIDGAMVRRLAVALTTQPGPVPLDRLTDALWGDYPPRSARKTLQGFVHRLRRAVGSDAVQTTAGGYRLGHRVVTLDVTMFEEELAVAEALKSTGQNQAALDVAEAARGRWRGLPFIDLGEWPGVLGDRARLEERFRLCEELVAGLRLDICPSDSLLGELEALAVRAPLRERRWSLLIEAERRAGRAAQALATFERARSVMVDALGAEPGRALQGLYQQLLVETGSLRGAVPAVDSVRSVTLPTPRSSFIGRALEVERLLDFIGRERLLTLVGVGGSGKTRLAIEVGRRWAETHNKAVWFADLTALIAPSDLAGTVAGAVHLGPVAHVIDVAEVCALLQRHDGLLVLDNCEHLLDAVAELVDQLLDAAPLMRLLSTSREPLGIDGERRWPVGPLSPGPEGDAVALFLTRAQARRPDFPASGGFLADVEALCAELDGLPLALELAAARVEVMSPADLRVHLASQGDLPMPGPGRAQPRPRPGGRRFSSLAAALRWSTDALSGDQRAAFQRLSVLPDSFGLSAAAHVCDLDDGAAMIVVESLLDKSLLAVAPHCGSVRFRMLDTVRRQAKADLAASPTEHRAARNGLLRWAASEARLYQALAGDGGRHHEATDLVDLEQRNIREALDWAATGGDLVDGLLVMCRTVDWWDATGRTDEGWERLERLLGQADTEPVPDRLWLRGVVGLAAFATFRDESARVVALELVVRAERRLARLTDRRFRLQIATQLAWIRLDFSDADSGQPLLDLLEESRRLGGLHESTILHFLALWQLRRDPVAALATAEACELAAERNGNEVSRAHAAEVRGIALTAIGRHTEARAYLGAALDGLTAAEHVGCIPHCLEAIAMWAGSAGRIAEARALLALAVGVRRTVRRIRASHEVFPYAAAVACCGEPTPATGDDLVANALTLGRDLLRDPEAISKR